MFCFEVNEAAIVNYIINQLVQIPNRQDLADLVLTLGSREGHFTIGLLPFSFSKALYGANVSGSPALQDIAFNMAKRFGLPGADELFQRQFNQLFASGDYKGIVCRSTSLCSIVRFTVLYLFSYFIG